jgi:hypothetical protein
MTYHHKNGMIYDSEDGQTIATMSESATPEQAALLAAADSLLSVAYWLTKEYEEGEGSIPDGLYNAARQAIQQASK